MELDAVEIMLDIEETFGICLPEERIDKLRSLANLHECIVAVLQQEQRNWRIETHEVWNDLQEIVARVIRMDRTSVTPNLLLTEDLDIEWQCGVSESP